MDPLSVTASVTAVIGLAKMIITRCKAYVSAVKDAPNDLCNILIEVGSISCVLETLEMRRKLSPALQGIGSANGPLEGCDRVLKALLQLFPTEADRPGKRKRSKPTVSYAELAWPFKEGKARKLLADLGRHKATIILILTTDAGQDIKSIKNNVEGIVDSLSDQERDAILKWLVKINPSSNHNQACQLHEDHTGQWLVRSTEYNDWLGGPIRFLWLHGIPGAGKTILASYIVQNTQNFCEASNTNDTGWAYYYCYYGRDKDETHPLLCWIISQLCRQLKYVPEKLRMLRNRGTEPGYGDLLEVLSTLVTKFRRVYIILDALDESRDRKFLLDLLIKIASDDAFEKVRLLAMSRKELDIQKAFEGKCSSISLSNSLVDEDICVYIESQLRTDRKLSRWPESLKKDIRDALVKGAKGMFRWVACQLDILGRVNSRPEILKALGELPETLEDTYERILVNINPSNRTIAHKALQIITYGDLGTIKEVAEAVVVDIDHESFTTDSRLFDPMDLLEICTCLITVHDNGEVNLAHYSVAEYLTSERILAGQAATFKTSMNEYYLLITRILIVYLLNLHYYQIPTAEEFFSYDEGDREKLEKQIREDYPLISYALWDWGTFLRLIEGPIGANLIELELRLFDPRADHFRWLEEQQKIFNWGMDYFFKFKSRPGAELSVALAYICGYGTTEVANALLLRERDISSLENRLEPCYEFLDHFNFFLDVEGTPLQVAATMRNAHLVEILIQHGADPNARHQGWTVLTSSLRSRHEFDGLGDFEKNFGHVVDLLLKAGANPNPSGICKTPIQLAVERSHSVDVMQLLVAAGSDVNAVGNEEAVIVDMRDRPRGKCTRQDSRSIESYYDTPLRILEGMTNIYDHEPDSEDHRNEEKRLAEFRRLLLQHGAISRHRSPQSMSWSHSH